MADYADVDVVPLTQPSQPKKKGKIFSTHEDVALCQAWIQVTEDAVIGTGQTKSSLWNHILRAFRAILGDSDRTIDSLQARRSLIRRACSRWKGILMANERAAQSGSNEYNWSHIARTQWIFEYKCPFNFEHCRDVLKHSAKFTDDSIETGVRNPNPEPMNPLGSHQSGSSHGDTTDPSGGSQRERPIGRKAEKASKQKTAIAMKEAELELKRIEIEQRKELLRCKSNSSIVRQNMFTLEKRKFYESFIAQDTSGFDPYQRQYIEEQKKAYKVELQNDGLLLHQNAANNPESLGSME